MNVIKKTETFPHVQHTGGGNIVICICKLEEAAPTGKKTYNFEDCHIRTLWYLAIYLVLALLTVPHFYIYPTKQRNYILFFIKH